MTEMRPLEVLEDFDGVAKSPARLKADWSRLATGWRLEEVHEGHAWDVYWYDTGELFAVEIESRGGYVMPEAIPRARFTGRFVYLGKWRRVEAERLLSSCETHVLAMEFDLEDE